MFAESKAKGSKNNRRLIFMGESKKTQISHEDASKVAGGKKANGSGKN